MIGNQLANRTHTAVTQVVNVISEATALGQIEEVPDDRNKILLREDRVVQRHVDFQPLVDLVPADTT